MNSKSGRRILPPSHQELLKRAMADGAIGTSVTAEQRLVLREICSGSEQKNVEPEDFLIAFKLALVDAANDVGIPPGPERNDFLSRLVSVYIEEFYRFPATGDGSSKAGSQELSAGGA